MKKCDSCETAIKHNELKERFERDHQSLNSLIMTVNTINTWLPRIEKMIERGIKGMHERQDKTNGKVIKNTTHRIEAQTTTSNIKWLLGFIGITNVGAILLLFLK